MSFLFAYARDKVLSVCTTIVHILHLDHFIPIGLVDSKSADPMLEAPKSTVTVETLSSDAFARKLVRSRDAQQPEHEVEDEDDAERGKTKAHGKDSKISPVDATQDPTALSPVATKNAKLSPFKSSHVTEVKLMPVEPTTTKQAASKATANAPMTHGTGAEFDHAPLEKMGSEHDLLAAATKDTRPTPPTKGPSLASATESTRLAPATDTFAASDNNDDLDRVSNTSNATDDNQEDRVRALGRLASSDSTESAASSASDKKTARPRAVSISGDGGKFMSMTTNSSPSYAAKLMPVAPIFTFKSKSTPLKSSLLSKTKSAPVTPIRMSKSKSEPVEPTATYATKPKPVESASTYKDKSNAANLFDSAPLEPSAKRVATPVPVESIPMSTSTSAPVASSATYEAKYAPLESTDTNLLEPTPTGLFEPNTSIVYASSTAILLESSPINLFESAPVESAPADPIPTNATTPAPVDPIPTNATTSAPVESTPTSMFESTPASLYESVPTNLFKSTPTNLFEPLLGSTTANESKSSPVEPTTTKQAASKATANAPMTHGTGAEFDHAPLEKMGSEHDLLAAATKDTRPTPPTKGPSLASATESTRLAPATDTFAASDNNDDLDRVSNTSNATDDNQEDRVRTLGRLASSASTESATSGPRRSYEKKARPVHVHISGGGNNAQRRRRRQTWSSSSSVSSSSSDDEDALKDELYQESPRYMPQVARASFTSI